jgi:shikimate kinase
MPKANIVLTGFMGTGKTTVGRLMAQRLNYEFIDTDRLIEERIGCTIAEFFCHQGEAAFRKLEGELAQELSKCRGLVISTGGRMMLDRANAAALGKTGRVFCLVATPEEILQRVSMDKNERPLLQGPDPLEKIVALLQEREPGYRAFTQIQTGAKTPAAIVDELLNSLRAEVTSQE